MLPDQPQQVLIERVEGDGGRLPLEASKNCAGIAALETLKAMGYPPFGVSLSLIKVYPGRHACLKSFLFKMDRTQLPAYSTSCQ